MTKYLGIALMLPGMALAAPFVIDDPVVGQTQCGFYLDAGSRVTVAMIPAPAPAVGNICKVDVGPVTVGSHTITFVFVSGLWESPQSAPFVFQKPNVGSAPTGLNLVGQ